MHSVRMPRLQGQRLYYRINRTSLMDGAPVSVSVHDLVEQPHLRLEVLAGAGGLNHVVTWAHSSDLREPWDWLAGGELLMKNGRTLPRTASGQKQLLDGLTAAIVSALVIGADPDTPPIGSDALARADELELPVLRVPFSVGFIVLSRAVADASLQDESDRLARTGRIYAAIHLAVAGGGSAAFIKRLERELHARLYVLDKATGEAVLDDTTKPSAALRKSLRTALQRHDGNVPGVLRLDAQRHMTVAVEVPYEEPTLLVAAPFNGQAIDLALLQHAATATAVEIAHASLRQDNRAQVGADLLAQLLDSRVDPATAERHLLAHAVDPSQARVLAARGASAESRRRLDIRLCRRHIDHLLLQRGEIVYVLVNSPDDNAVATVRDHLSTDNDHVAVGVSDVLRTPARLPDTAREATWALEVAAARPHRVARYGDAAPLPALDDPHQAQALVDHVLGALLEYDHDTGSELVLSLTTFLSCRRSWQRTARELNIHRQTVVYRMQRVAQITGRNLADTADIAQFWLALSALRILTNAPHLPREA